MSEEKVMRAKMSVQSVTLNQGGSETVAMTCVAAKSYPPDGMDENNTFAKFSPSGDLRICIANPALFGKVKPGDTFYVDFTRAPA